MSWWKKPSKKEILAVAYHETNLWLAKSSKGSWDYEVRTDADGGWFCTCPDWKYNMREKGGVRVCKHISRVVANSGEIPTLEGADEQFVMTYLANILRR